jgi:RNA polymerase sigma-70 factor, ECF subfamily
MGAKLARLWRGAGRFEGKCRVSTWLLAIARNKALQGLRKRKESQLDDGAALTIEDSSDDPEEHLVTQERDLLVHRCLSQLPPAHRQIIDLYYLQEKSVSEVADLVGIPTSTVKTRMSYARNRMSELLEQAGIRSNSSQ